MLHRFALGSLLLSGCGSSEPEDSEGDSQDSETVDSPVDTGPQLPADPRPLTVETTGGWAQTIVFDTPSCLHYPEAAPVTFRQFWRGSNHNAVLIIEVLSTFAGAGDYNSTDHNLRVRLQSEAGSAYNMSLSADTSQGDSATLTVEHISTIGITRSMRFWSRLISSSSSQSDRVTTRPDSPARAVRPARCRYVL